MTAPNAQYNVAAVHWLPARTFRPLLRKIKHRFFIDWTNLNLPTSGGLRQLAVASDISAAEVRTVGLLGWPSNLLLVARKSISG